MRSFSPRSVPLMLSLVLWAALGRAQEQPASAPADLLVAVDFYRGQYVGSQAPPSGLQRWNSAAGTWESLAWKQLICSSVSLDPSGRWIYLGCGNGVLASRDGGRSWWLSGGWEMAEVQRVCIDRRDPRRAWAVSAYGLHRCENILAERPWMRFEHDEHFRQCSDVLQDAANAEMLWIASERGIFTSPDGGRTVRRSGPAVRVRRIVQDWGAPAHLWATSDGRGLLETRDRGRSWTALAGSPPVCFCLARDPVRASTLVVGAMDGVHRSSDGGRSWKRASAGLPADLLVFALAFDPAVEHRVCLSSTNGVFESRDGGWSWKRLGLREALAPDLCFARRAVVPREAPSARAGTLHIDRSAPPLAEHRPSSDEGFEQRRARLLAYFRAHLPGADAGRIGFFQAILAARQDPPPAHLWKQVRAQLEQPGSSMFFSLPAIGLYLHARERLPADLRERFRVLLSEHPIYRGDTENHWVLHYSALALACQSWPQTPAARWYMGRSTQSLYEEARGWLLHWARLSASRGQGEFDSPHYMFMFITPMLLLYDFAAEPRLHQLAGMMLDLLLADYLGESLQGAYCGGHSRAPGRCALETRDNRAAVYHYLYAGGIPMPAKPHAWIIPALVSSYRPPREFAALANERARPYVHTEVKRVRNVIRFGRELNPPVYKSDYMSARFCLGSLQGGILQPIQQHTWDVTWMGSAMNATLFSVHPSVWGRELGMFFPEEVHYLTRSVSAQKSSYTSPLKWISASPWEKIRQREHLLAALYRVPPRWRFEHVDLHWPHCLARSEEGGWLFGRDGEFFLALAALQPVSWIAEKECDRLRCAGARAGFVVVLPPPELQGGSQGDFERFRARVLAAPRPELRGAGDDLELRYEAPWGGPLELRWGADPATYCESEHLFQGPFLNSRLGSAVVRLSCVGTIRVLDFNDFTIRVEGR